MQQRLCLGLGYALFGILLVGLMSVPTQAQEYSIGIVMEQLEALLELEEDDGMSLHNYIVGKLNEGETDAWTMNLSKGVAYDIWGVCDEDCTDVDLRIYREEDGSLLVEDIETDDTPLGIISPEKDGRYTIELDMYDCSIEPCFFGIGIFAD